MIAHWLSMVPRADAIVALEKGRVAEIGRHEELLKSSDLYQRMCERLSVGQPLDDPAGIDDLIETAGK